MLNGRRIKLLASILSEERSDAAPGEIVDPQTMRFCGGDGLCVIPLVAQLEGARAMPVSELLRGFPIKIGDRFTMAEG